MRETLTEQIHSEVWSTLNDRRWFGKHIEHDDIDDLYEALGAAIDKVIKERIG